MLDQTDIDTVAAEVARNNLPAGALISTSSRPYEDYYGGDELMVTVMIKDSFFSDVTGRQLNRITGDVQQELIKRGELRFAYIEWKTDAPPLPQDAPVFEDDESN